MKLNLKGIRFNTWLYFLGFSLSILTLLGFLLVVLIKPYYRNDRLKIVESISNTIEELLLKDNVSKKDLNNTDKLVIGSNVYRGSYRLI